MLQYSFQFWMQKDNWKTIFWRRDWILYLIKRFSMWSLLRLQNWPQSCFFCKLCPFFEFCDFFFTTKKFDLSITSSILIAQSWLRYHSFEKKLNFEIWKIHFDAIIASIEKSASKSSCVTFARGCNSISLLSIGCLT